MAIAWWEKAIDAVGGLFGVGGVIDQLVPDSDKREQLKYALATALAQVRIVQYTLCVCLLLFAGTLCYQIIFAKPVSVLLIVLVIIGYGGNFQFTAQLISGIVDLLKAMTEFGTAIVTRITPEKKR